MRLARGALGSLVSGAIALGCATSPRPSFDEVASADLEGEPARVSDDAADAAEVGDAGPKRDGDAEPETSDCASLPGDPAVYARMYMDALRTNTVRSCAAGCAPTECCYDLIACLARP